jgi:hypothetical protein
MRRSISVSYYPSCQSEYGMNEGGPSSHPGQNIGIWGVQNGKGAGFSPSPSASLRQKCLRCLMMHTCKVLRGCIELFSFLIVSNETCNYTLKARYTLLQVELYTSLKSNQTSV